METQSTPPTRIFLPAAFLLMVAGWGGLYSLVQYTSPNGGTRWAMFFALVLAVSGTALPVVAFLNRRFPSTPPVNPGVVLREAVWVGIYVPTLARLQTARLLTPALALLLACGFLLAEFSIRLRERAHYRP